jgi:hypothetical protein
MRCIAHGAAAELGPAGLKQSSPTTPGPSPLLGAPHGDPNSVAADRPRLKLKAVKLRSVCRAPWEALSNAG